MSDNIRSLIEEHHAFYEVMPYYAPADKEHVNAAAQRVQAGFNVDIYAVRTIDDEPVPPPPDEYGIGWAELQHIADAVSELLADCCSLEVIPFPSVAIIDGRDGEVESLLRLRISRRTGVDEPIGAPEQQALEEIEKKLRTLGVTLRGPRT